MALMWLLTVTCFVSLGLGWIGELLPVSETIRWLPYGLYVISYISGGYYTVQSAWESLKEWQFDVNVLMIVVALGAAYVGEPKEGALLMFLFSLSSTLETYTMNRTSRNIGLLMSLMPKKARRMSQEGQEEMVEIEAITKGDVVLIKPGEMISVDGVVEEGESTVDEVSLTGESRSVVKKVESRVYAGTMNHKGYLTVRVNVAVKDFTVSKVIEMIKEAREQKAKSQDFTDRIIGQYYSMSVVGITVVAFLGKYFWLRAEWNDAIYFAMTLMVVASPCALVISIPSAILSALSNAARSGVLFKGGEPLEKLGRINAIAFDKTGTLTKGKFSLISLIPVSSGALGRLTVEKPLLSVKDSPAGGFLETMEHERLLLIGASLEAYATHPIAEAIVERATSCVMKLSKVEGFELISGQGVKAEVDGVPWAVGKPGAFCVLEAEQAEQVKALEAKGETVVVVSSGDEVCGILGIMDALRKEAPVMVEEVKREGIKHVTLLTGDHNAIAQKVGKACGIEDIHANLLPQDKVRLVKGIQAKRSTLMIGDGINDAPSLAVADVGMAMGTAGTDLAIESADVILMRDDLRAVAKVIRLGRRTRRIIQQNMTFAIVGMGILMGFAIFGDLPLPLGIVGHEGSTLLVVLNSLRLLRREKN